jgi:BirA family transcriptional regulator, biotin operon repressor / biotin---[acetyl-CoA-carboxylase] ligase
MPETRFQDVRRFDTIDSTNRYLLDEARGGAPEGVVAVADHQTAGRGRLGRSWEAPPGANLLVSVLLRPALAPGDRHLATTAVALAAADAVDAVVDGVSVAVKWPNDLVAPDGRKLAGVLAEADLTSGGGDPASGGVDPASGSVDAAPVVVGIGINVNWPASDEDLPPELRGAAVSLRQLAGGPVDREALLAVLLGRLEPRVASLATDDGRASLAGDLRARCRTIGTRVRVELPTGSFEGTATGITPAGHLTVDDDGTERTVVAGDVIHVRPGT